MYSISLPKILQGFMAKIGFGSSSTDRPEPALLPQGVLARKSVVASNQPDLMQYTARYGVLGPDDSHLGIVVSEKPQQVSKTVDKISGAKISRFYDTIDEVFGTSVQNQYHPAKFNIVHNQNYDPVRVSTSDGRSVVVRCENNYAYSVSYTVAKEEAALIQAAVQNLITPINDDHQIIRIRPDKKKEKA